MVRAVITPKEDPKKKRLRAPGVFIRGVLAGFVRDRGGKFGMFLGGVLAAVPPGFGGSGVTRTSASGSRSHRRGGAGVVVQGVVVVERAAAVIFFLVGLVVDDPAPNAAATQSWPRMAAPPPGMAASVVFIGLPRKIAGGTLSPTWFACWWSLVEKENPCLPGRVCRGFC